MELVALPLFFYSRPRMAVVNFEMSPVTFLTLDPSYPGSKLERWVGALYYIG